MFRLYSNNRQIKKVHRYSRLRDSLHLKRTGSGKRRRLIKTFRDTYKSLNNITTTVFRLLIIFSRFSCTITNLINKLSNLIVALERIVLLIWSVMHTLNLIVHSIMYFIYKIQLIIKQVASLMPVRIIERSLKGFSGYISDYYVHGTLKQRTKHILTTVRRRWKYVQFNHMKISQYGSDLDIYYDVQTEIEYFC
ncbi:unnamed protein product [Didymodactylos carnosus]|uniref:Uncharacterized protein n=1 Tax=Didymodactylos carnosus TaxID=1234261 RepID=A0A815ZR76_9BILA|nr:unnamed protein product [Didymodactylos carnosus]CAF4456640.1 unnamed protein product [Didymodactylos carnosus]